MCKYMVEHLSEELLIQQFEATSPNNDGEFIYLFTEGSKICVPNRETSYSFMLYC